MFEENTLGTYRASYRWVMLAMLWLLYMSFGLISRSASPLVTVIMRDLNLTYSEMGFILGAWQLTYIGVALIGGTIIDRWGIRKSLLLGAFIIGCSAMLRYFVNGFASMLLAVILFGVGGPMISVGCPKTISMWFDKVQRRTAVGVYTTAVSIGGFLALSLTNSLVMPVAGYSWRLTFVYYGLIACFAAILWWFLAKEPRTRETTRGSSVIEVFINLFRLRKVQLVLIIGLLCFLTNHGFTNWLPKILETKGLSPTTAGYMASIPMGIGTLAIFLIPHFVPPRLRGRVISICSLISAISILAIVTSSGPFVFVGLALFGLTVPAIMPLLILVLMDMPEVGSKYMGSAGGAFYCVAEIGGFTGPLILGSLVDMTGNFLAGGIFLTASLLTVLIMALFLKAESTY